METELNIDLKFMRIADKIIAQQSKDYSTKVGAIIVKDGKIISSGFNDLPRGCNKNINARYDRPEKYNWFKHAEEYAIINAARDGIATLDADMYLNWYPCANCAGSIVSAGIKRLFCDKEPDWNDEKWGDSFNIAKIILNESGVEVIYMDYNANRKEKI